MSRFWQFFDSQMAIFRKVRSVSTYCLLKRQFNQQDVNVPVCFGNYSHYRDILEHKMRLRWFKYRVTVTSGTTISVMSGDT